MSSFPVPTREGEASASESALTKQGHLSFLSRRQPQLTLPCVVRGSAGCLQLDHAKGMAGLESYLRLSCNRAPSPEKIGEVG